MHDLIQIKAVVEGAYHDIDISDKTRQIPYPDGIKIYSYIAKQATDHGTTEIARLVNRSHSTISVAIKRCEELMQVDKDFRDKVRYCKKICANILNLKTATYKERIDIYCESISAFRQGIRYTFAILSSINPFALVFPLFLFDFENSH